MALNFNLNEQSLDEVVGKPYKYYQNFETKPQENFGRRSQNTMSRTKRNFLQRKIGDQKLFKLPKYSTQVEERHIQTPFDYNPLLV